MPGSLKRFVARALGRARRGTRPPTRAQRLKAMDLTELAEEFGTDKWGVHRYTPHYQRHLGHLRRRRFTLLEIGIGGGESTEVGGESLRMWRWFFPRAKVVGLDIFDKSWVDNPRITTYQGSQVDGAILRRIIEEQGAPRVVIDDGSHRPEHVRETFRLLFPMLPNGAIYVIEDIQTSYWPAWGGSTDRHSQDTSMALVKDLLDGLNHVEFLEEGYQPSYADRHVVGVHAYHNLVFIEKGRNDERTNKAALAGMPDRGTDPALPVSTDVEPFTGDDPTTPGLRALGDLRFDGDDPSVVLCLQSLSRKFIFAGIRTAILAAAALADELDRPLRVIAFEEAEEPARRTLKALRSILASAGHERLAESVRLSAADARDSSGHHPDDVWMATLWSTAWCLERLCRRGQVSAERVVYLIQDYEPGFYPWGDLYLKATSTYDAGFIPLINSASLARYVDDRTDIEVDPDCVFAPQVDVAALREAAAGWRPASPDRPRVLFYARPAAGRNMFTLGLQALREWAAGLPDGVRPVVRMAGAPIGRPVDLGPRVDVEVLGKTSLADYYRLVADTDLGLALMCSPHPGHLALELPLAGIPTVTNRFERYRSEWVEGLVVGDADGRALAAALEESRVRAAGLPTHERAAALHDVGGTLQDAVAAVARRLR